MPEMDMDDLYYMMQMLHPGTTNGIDYTTCRSLDAETMEQIGEAYFFNWNMPFPEPTPEELLEMWRAHGKQVTSIRIADALRKQRSDKLLEADKFVERAIDQGDAAAERAARDYRQALRDVPQQPGFPDVCVWPTLPKLIKG